MTSTEPGPRQAGDPSREKLRVEDQCPGLRGKVYDVKSESCKKYNCFAWATGDHRRYWAPMKGYYWPEELPRETIPSVAVIEQYFVSRGFTRCQSTSRKPGIEKIAILGDTMGALHVARQPAGEPWLSKMGDGPDIEHDALEWIECGFIGQIQVVLSRPASSELAD